MRNTWILCSLVVTVGACSGAAVTSGDTSVACQALSDRAAVRPKAFGGTVFTIVMENRSRDEILSGPDTPFIQSLARQNAVAAGYHDAYVHPSNPNYIWMVSGQNFGILANDDPGATQHITSTSHLADQIERAGLDWRTYQQSMGEACGFVSHGDYAAKHNPFIYFDDINGWDGTATHRTQRCIDHVVDYATFDADLAAGKLPAFVFITPDLKHDMHHGSVAEGDAWLASEVPKILASPAFNEGGALFLLWDEGGGSPAADDPPFLAISPHAKPGYVSTVDYDTSAFLKTVQLMLGVEALPCAAAPESVSAMDDLFSAPLTPGG